ncbi:MAG: hypothetical protein ACPGSK_07935 [Alphaproteobacteria bacterium]
MSETDPDLTGPSDADIHSDAGAEVTESETDAQNPIADWAAPSDGSDTGEEASNSSEELAGEANALIFDLGGTTHRIDQTGMSAETVAKVEDFATALHSDYSDKTEKVADTERVNNTIKDYLTAIRSLDDHEQLTIAQCRTLATNLTHLRGQLTEALWQVDPTSARQLVGLIEQTKAQYDAALSDANAIQRQTEYQQATTNAALAERGRAYVAKHVKDFDEAALIKFAIANGISEDSARNWALNAEVTVLVHEAMQFRAQKARAQHLLLHWKLIRALASDPQLIRS